MNIIKSKWGVAAIAGVLVIGGGFAAMTAANAEPEPVAVVVTDEPTTAPVVVPERDAVVVVPAPVVEPEPVVVEPAPVVEPEPYVEPFVEPEGDPAEWVESSDPNLRDGGEWDTTQCASGRFVSDSSGTPVCQG